MNAPIVPLSKQGGRMSLRVVKFCVVAFLLMCVTGCTQKVADAGTVVCSYQWWVGPVSLLVGVGLTAAGWANRKDGIRAILFLVVAAALTVGFAPFGFFDKVVVDKDHMESRWGLWCYPTTHHVRFDDVTTVRFTSEESTGRRGRRKINYYYEFNLKSGQIEKVTADNSLMEEAAGDLIAQLQQRGIPLIKAIAHE